MAVLFALIRGFIKVKTDGLRQLLGRYDEDSNSYPYSA
ncbi:MAG: hypothetical protein ACLSHU_00080 [Oscillospiraceae bacterium]